MEPIKHLYREGSIDHLIYADKALFELPKLKALEQSIGHFYKDSFYTVRWSLDQMEWPVLRTKRIMLGGNDQFFDMDGMGLGFKSNINNE